MDELMHGEFERWVPRDGADNTPVKEFEKYLPGQWLARILDADKDERLRLCEVALNSMDTAVACEGRDHQGEIDHLRRTQVRMSIERHEMHQLINWLSAYKGIADSVISYAEHINDDSDADYTRMALAEKINGWASMAKTVQANTQSERQTASDGDSSSGSDTPNKD